MSAAAQLETLLTEDDVAKRYGVTVRTVQKWRHSGVGPAYLKVGGGEKSPIRYRPSDLDAFDRKSLVSPKEQP
ncbi:helix-turn-helix domain-containing protein [Bradyrhizobium elkanii]|uniref:helix-turn-helix domain-containing protein n=1 Tax=Bradyrhizobium elkanii TaxID=29448 RepID=UPI003513ED03